MDRPFFRARAAAAALPVVGLTGLALVLSALAAALTLRWPAARWALAVVSALILGPAGVALVRRWAPPPPPRTPIEVLDTPSGIVDEATRTLNRRGITSSLIEAMAQSQRYSTPLSLVVVALDVGDPPSALTDPLARVAAALSESVRLPDRLGRYQDQEFLVVLPQTRLEEAMKVGERLRTTIATLTARAADGGRGLTVSVGIAAFGRGQDLERFLANAHTALAAAQAAGGDRVSRFQPDRAVDA